MATWQTSIAGGSQSKDYGNYETAGDDDEIWYKGDNESPWRRRTDSGASSTQWTVLPDKERSRDCPHPKGVQSDEQKEAYVYQYSYADRYDLCETLVSPI